MYQEEDYLMLSGIQHFIFCRRQWALVHIEQQWEENYRTTAGELMHKNAHNETNIEKRGNLLILRGMRVFSPAFGISGQCDVVEAVSEDEGIPITGYEGKWRFYPVEYKYGKMKTDIEDEAQLCAQALCLEEMLAVHISEGAVYYGAVRKRECVKFTDKLRESVAEACEEMHQLIKRGYTPKVKKSKKCLSCSLKDICLPELSQKMRTASYIEGMMREEKTP